MLPVMAFTPLYLRYRHAAIMGERGRIAAGIGAVSAAAEEFAAAAQSELET